MARGKYGEGNCSACRILVGRPEGRINLFNEPYMHQIYIHTSDVSKSPTCFALL